MITISNNKIKYSYTLSKFEDSVYMVTSFMAEGMVTEKAEDLSERYILGSDKKALLVELLKGAIANIQSIFGGLTDGVTASVSIGESVDISIKEPTNYDANIAVSIDDKLFEAIRDSIVRVFYLKRDNEGLIKLSEISSNESILVLKNLLNGLKRGTFSSYLD